MAKQIYITGGASGIGLQLARNYVRSRAHVTLFDVQPLEDAKHSLDALSATPSTRIHRLDLADWSSVKYAFARAAAEQLPDVVINCAGVALARRFIETDENEFARVININLIGSSHVAKAAAMFLRPGGQLVLTASMAGLVPCYGYAAYGASKYGVVGLAEVLRIELAIMGISVSVVCPPEVDTPMVTEERRGAPPETASLKRMAGSLSLTYAARAIQKGIDKREFLIIPGRRAGLLRWLNKISPEFLTQCMTDGMISRMRRGRE